jgi:hypothetical protein
MADEWAFEQVIQHEEAMRLIQGVKPATLANAHVGYGDICFNFELPDGWIVQYKATLESDYYGGEYLSMTWFLLRRAGDATEAVPPLSVLPHDPTQEKP